MKYIKITSNKISDIFNVDFLLHAWKLIITINLSNSKIKKYTIDIQYAIVVQ